MKHTRLVAAVAVFSGMSLTGCEVAGDIFKAGVWVGVILVVGVIGLIVWMVSKARG
jgi:energy-converting hydrogenase Eha subunit H